MSNNSLSDSPNPVNQLTPNERKVVEYMRHAGMEEIQQLVRIIDRLAASPAPDADDEDDCVPAPPKGEPMHGIFVDTIVPEPPPFEDDAPEAPAAAAAKQSVRKPHNNLAGYIAELKNRRTGIGHVVIYRASETGIDVGDNRWVVVCETHGTMVGCSSMPQARAAMKAVDFCEECAALDAAKGGTR